MATFRKRNNKWQAQIYLGERKIAKTFTNKTDAKRWASEQQRLAKVTPNRVIFPEPAVELPDYTMRQVLQKYLDEVIPMLSDPQKTKYIVTRHFKIDWIDTPFNQLTTTTLNKWRDQSYRTVSNKTVWGYFNLFKTALNHAIADDWVVPIKLFRGIKLKKVVERQVHRLEDAQLEALLEAAYAQAKCNYLPHIITFSLETCMRKGEMLQLEWPMVDFERKVINLPGRITKTKEPRTIPMSHKCEEALLAIQELVAAGDAVYRLNARFKTDLGKLRVWPVTIDGLRKVWSTCRVNTAMEHLHWHDLRHEGISRLFELGLTVPEVRSISGHKTLIEVSRYSHASTAAVMAKLRGAAQ